MISESRNDKKVNMSTISRNSKVSFDLNKSVVCPHPIIKIIPNGKDGFLYLDTAGQASYYNNIST